MRFFKFFLSFLLLFFLISCQSKKDTISITLPDNSIVNAELAITPEEHEQGLMYRTKLAKDGGMLFIFPNEAPRYFWMKNTLIDLDILFISQDKIVNQLAIQVPHSYTYTPDNQVAVRAGYGKYVLELPSGSIKKHNISLGSKIIFDDNSLIIQGGK